MSGLSSFEEQKDIVLCEWCSLATFFSLFAENKKSVLRRTKVWGQVPKYQTSGPLGEDASLKVRIRKCVHVERYFGS